MTRQSLALICIIMAGTAGLTACTPSRTTPSLPPISSQPMSRSEAAIQNTEALDQSLQSGYTGPR